MDEGETWPITYVIPGLTDTNQGCEGSMIVAGEERYLYYSGITPSEPIKTRSALKMYVSMDQGNSWEYFQSVFPGFSGYSQLVDIPSRREIGVLFEKGIGNVDVKWNYEHIVYEAIPIKPARTYSEQQSNQQCHVDESRLQIDGDRTDNPSFDYYPAKTLSECTAACDARQDIDGRPCVAVEWKDGGAPQGCSDTPISGCVCIDQWDPHCCGGKTMSNMGCAGCEGCTEQDCTPGKCVSAMPEDDSNNQYQCNLMWGCDYTEYWAEGSVYKAKLLEEAPIPVVNKGGNPSETLNECEGDCDEDDDCAKDLRCWARYNWDSPVPPGCSGTAYDESYDYCYDPSRGRLPLDNDGNPSAHCQCLDECAGDCDYDDDCVADLKCWHRSGREGIPPGCWGEVHEANHDYCYDPAKAGEVLIVFDLSSVSSHWVAWLVVLSLALLTLTLYSCRVSYPRRKAKYAAVDCDSEDFTDNEAMPMHVDVAE